MEKDGKSLTPEGYRTLNAVCDEFRRLLKAALVESTEGGGVVTSNHVLDAARRVHSQPWLEQFRDQGPDESDRRAA
jgi:hypothetical protein